MNTMVLKIAKPYYTYLFLPRSLNLEKLQSKYINSPLYVKETMYTVYRLLIKIDTLKKSASNKNSITF